MVVFAALVLAPVLFAPSARAYPPGSIDSNQLTETQVMDLEVQILKDDIQYTESIYNTAGGYFGNGQFTEAGIRTNGDVALMYAFLYSHFPDATFHGVPRQTLLDHAIAAIRYGYSTHQGSGTGKWGNTFETPLWVSTFGMAAWLLQPELSAADSQGVKAMITNEANVLAGTTPPTSEQGDTQAESNAWNTNVLALASAMFPDDPSASAWGFKLDQYAMNTFSTTADMHDQSVVDGRPVSQWVLGPNIHPDLTLDNHNIFHPTYVAGPIWEMTESATFYAHAGLPVPAALQHHVRDVWDQVESDLEQGTGEPGYPNGVDWDIHRGDDIETFADMSTLYKDPTAKFFEARDLQYIRARQLTTPDGSYLLNPDVGAEREVIVSSALVYSYLAHESFGQWPAASTTWNAIRAAGRTKLFPSVDAVTNLSPDRWASFSWRDRYMGLVYPDSEAHLDNPYTTFPYQNGITGSFTGSFAVTGTSPNATVRARSYSLSKNGFATAGQLAVNNGQLNQNLAFVALPDNAVVYLDKVRAAQNVTVTSETGVPIGIESDTIGGDPRTLYYQGGSTQSNGNPGVLIPGQWVNVDGRLGLVMGGADHGQSIFFGQRAVRNSVNTALLYGSFSTSPRNIPAGGTVADRVAVLYSNVDQGTTASLANAIQYPTVSPWWRAVIVPEPDGRVFLVTANLNGNEVAQLSLPVGPNGSPVLTTGTSITPTSASAQVQGRAFTAQYQELGVYIKALSGAVDAVQGATPQTAFVQNPGTTPAAIKVSIQTTSGPATGQQTLQPGSSYRVDLQGGSVQFRQADYPGNERLVSAGKYITSSSFQPAHLPFAALDGDPDTYWASQDQPTQSAPQTLSIDLQGDHNPHQVGVLAPSGHGPRDVTVEVSTDGTTFTPVASATLPDSGALNWIRFPANNKADYVRLSVTSSYDPTSLQVSELEVSGTPMLAAGHGQNPFSIDSPASSVPVGAGSTGQAHVRITSNADIPLDVTVDAKESNPGITASPAHTTVAVPPQGVADATINLQNSYPTDLASGGPSQLQVTAIASGVQADATLSVLPYSTTLPLDPTKAHFALDAGCATSPVAPGYQALTPASAFDTAQGYGWIGSTSSLSCRDRGTQDAVKRDLVTDQSSPDTLRLTVPAGTHNAYLLIGDANFATPGAVVSVGETVLARTYPTAAGQFGWTKLQLDGGSSGGTIDVTFSGNGISAWNFDALVIG